MTEPLCDEELIEAAYHWLCQQRQNFPANSDIWDLRFHWRKYKSELLTQLQHQTFYFSPLQQITKANGENIHLWSSIDSLVLKMLTIALARYLPSSKLCTHLKNHGGAKQAVNLIYTEYKHLAFVFRTDVKHYYESINHSILLNKLSVYIKDKFLLNLLAQYMKRTIERGGNFEEIDKGISAGCPLSPLIASFYLVELDKTMEDKPVFYRRYMDDIIILAKTRWQLRKAIKTVNQFFAQLKLAQHPDKTFIGKADKGFDFLGYQFDKANLTISTRTLKNHIRRITQLYEQKKGQPNWLALLDDYRHRWARWVTAGIEVSIDIKTIYGERLTLIDPELKSKL